MDIDTKIPSLKLNDGTSIPMAGRSQLAKGSKC